MRLVNMGTWDERVRTRIAERIKRFPRKITQQMLADATGWSQPNVSQYFKGRIDADLDKLDAMAKLLHLRLADLFTDAEPEIDELLALVASLSEPARMHLMGLLKAPELWPPATPQRPPASRAKRAGTP
jgi:transcriptional regulator with XRE-family HTH domain